MLKEGFSSTGVLFQGPGSGQLIPEGPRSSYESWLIFPITFIQCCSVCSWSWSVCYVGGQKFHIRKEGSVAGKITVATNPALMSVKAAAKLRRLLMTLGTS